MILDYIYQSVMTIYTIVMSFYWLLNNDGLNHKLNWIALSCLLRITNLQHLLLLLPLSFNSNSNDNDKGNDKCDRFQIFILLQ